MRAARTCARPEYRLAHRRWHRWWPAGRAPTGWRPPGQQFPGAVFYFLPSDIVTQTINFGLPAPFDIQIVGRNVEGNREAAAELAEKVRHIRGAGDLRALPGFVNIEPSSAVFRDIFQPPGAGHQKP